MHKCSICKDVSRPRQPRLTHVIERRVPRRHHVPGVPLDAHATRTEIAAELTVCVVCKEELRTQTLAHVRALRANLHLRRLAASKPLRAAAEAPAPLSEAEVLNRPSASPPAPPIILGRPALAGRTAKRGMTTNVAK